MKLSVSQLEAWRQLLSGSLVEATDAVVAINFTFRAWSYLNNPGRLDSSPTSKLAVEIDMN